MREAALTMLGILSKAPPFSYMNIPRHRERIEKVFTADNALKYVEFAIKALTQQMELEEALEYKDAIMLQRYTAVFGHLAYSLGEYQKAMLDFAEKSDGNEADRTAEGFARMFGSYFPPEFSITEGNAWMSTLSNSVQYVSTIRPGEKDAKLVKRIHYVSFVGMFRSDLFEGLCVGHAPKKCRICGKWFLTTNARHTKSVSYTHLFSIRWKSCRPWMFFPENPSSEYSPAITISSYAAYFLSLSRWASKLYPSTCIEVDTLV